jgi:hypothetical protein
MNEAKIIFSAPELELMKNAEFILTKNIVMQKMKHMLEDVQNELYHSFGNIKSGADKNVFTIPPKVSKGENYQGLPYLVLDYPRKFDGNNIFAIRSFFWWGNFYSTTLVLSGDHKQKHLTNIITSYNQFSVSDYYIGTNPDPWQHHFKKDNYQLINELTAEKFAENCNAFNHIKIGKKWSLNDVHSATENIKQSWKFLLECL